MLGGHMGGGGVRYRSVEKVKFNPALLKRAFRYVTPYWRQWLLVVVCLIFTSRPARYRHCSCDTSSTRRFPPGTGSRLSLLALGVVLVPLFAGLVRRGSELPQHHHQSAGHV